MWRVREERGEWREGNGVLVEGYTSRAGKEECVCGEGRGRSVVSKVSRGEGSAGASVGTDFVEIEVFFIAISVGDVPIRRVMVCDGTTKGAWRIKEVFEDRTTYHRICASRRRKRGGPEWFR